MWSCSELPKLSIFRVLFLFFIDAQPPTPQYTKPRPLPHPLLLLLPPPFQAPLVDLKIRRAAVLHHRDAPCLVRRLPVIPCPHTSNTYARNAHTCAHTFTRTRICTRTWIDTRANMYAQTHTCRHTHVHPHSHAYMYKHTRTHTHTHTLSYTHTYTHTHTHAHKYTHMYT